MTKKELRKVAMSQRRLLSDADIANFSRQLLERFITLDLSAVKHLHIFLPIIEKKEPDTFLFVEWLSIHRPDIHIVVPKADFTTALMSSHRYEGKGYLQKNIYNILEPQDSVLHTGDVDLVLVPLLAFDELGYRVGYGRGFYDRFLKGLDTLKIGVSLFAPTENIEDVHESDIQLDMCITPEKIYTFMNELPPQP